MVDLGRALDKDDAERAEVGKHPDLYGVDLSELRRKFFGKVISENLRDRRTTLLTGPQVEMSSNMIPFLYFYPTISLQICPHCPQARNPQLIEPFLERGLISVFMIGPFSQAPKRYQQLAFEYPELFVGPNSYHRYQYYALNPVEPWRAGHENHYCYRCVLDRLKPNIPRLDNLEPDIRDAMRRTLSGILSLQTPYAEKLADEFAKTLQNPDAKEVAELRSTVILADYLASANAIGAVPQIEADHLARTEQFVRALRIYHPSNMDLGRYLDLIEDFRGKLSGGDMPLADDQILTEVRRINEEVFKIQTSKRLQVGTFAWRIAHDLPSLFLRILTNGSFDWEGAVKEPLRGYKSSRAAKMKAELLSKYFAVSQFGVYIWQIRKRIANRS